MHYIKTFLPITTLTLLLVACGNSNNTSTETTPMSNNSRFVTMTMMNQNLLQDNTTKLEWIEGNNVPNVASGCNPQPAGKTEPEIKNIAEQFCQDLEFGSHGDWRMATASEHKEFITSMKEAGKTPFYANPACPRLVALEADGTIKTVNTHNTAPVGEILPWTNLNAGIKCVRSF